MTGCSHRINSTKPLMVRGLGHTYYIGSDNKDHYFVSSYFMSPDRTLYIDKKLLILEKEVPVNYDRSKWFVPQIETKIVNGQMAGHMLSSWQNYKDVIRIVGNPIER